MVNQARAYVLAVMGARGLAFLRLFVVVRLLGEAGQREFGAYRLGLEVINWLVPLTMLGLADVAERYAARMGAGSEAGGLRRTVMGHLGLMPQSIYKFGTYTVRAKEKEEADLLRKNAKLLEDLGCFGIVLEKIPAALGEEVAKAAEIPIIGIGAGGGVDGQVLVLHDMLGITKEFKPRFLRTYLNLYDDIKGAVERYVTDVKRSDFPNETEQY